MIQTLPDLVSRMADRQPEATAIVMDDERLTYAELEAASNRVGNVLREHGCAPGDRVCLFLPKSPAAITSILGVLKARCAYVPIDTMSPAARVARVVASTEPALVLAAADTGALLDALFAAGALPGAIPVGTMERDPIPGDRVHTSFTGAHLEQASAELVASPQRSDAPAHILFTSGSTGMPKGVVITHANVLAFLEWAIPYFAIAPGDRISGHPPLHFDLSTFDIFGSLGAGAELHPVPQPLNLLPTSIVRFIESHELTQWFSVPSAMTFIASHGALPKQGFPTLRRVIWCGEVLPTPVLAAWMDCLPSATFTNLYGPTEATIASSYHTFPGPLEDPTAPIPIGVACPGEELVILDDNLQVAPPGEIGDLYLGGVGLSPGYWRDEDRTREVFVSDPRRAEGSLYRTGDLARLEDGVYWFQGRSDSQIKSRGYRIELGEIEAALNAVPGIAESAVVAIETDGFEGFTICGAYVPTPGSDVSEQTAREALRAAVPPYMLPNRWATLDALPKNANGKIDRPALRGMFSNNTEPQPLPAPGRAAR